MNLRLLRFALGAFVLGSLLIGRPFHAAAQMGAEYTFSAATNIYNSISGGTLAIGGNTTGAPSLYNENESRGPYDIGFNFTFGCNVYSQFSLTSSGYLILGGSVPANQFVNNLTGAPLYPVIAPFWERQHYYNTYTVAGCPAGGPTEDVGVRFLTTGSAPNRILTVEWKTNLGGDAPYWITCGVPAMHTYMVRLYEGSNRIAFHYGAMVVPGNANANSSVSIGMATSSTDFLSVTPGAPPSVSSSVANNTFNHRVTPLTAGTEYTFTPDRLVLAGRVGAGNEGVANPVNGAELLGNVVQSISTQVGYTPLDLRKACAAPSMPVTMTITGAQASEYTFDVSGTQNWSPTLTTNAAIAPRINFRPLGGGVRNATLTITNQLTNQSISFALAGEGVPRVVWTGNTADGGTAGVADGDILLDGIQVIYGESRTFHPLTLRNILAPSVPAPPAPITYTLIDPTGSYSIAPASAALNGGETSTPDIIFSATHGVGTQEATLIVNAEGDIRRFTLRAYAAAPGGELYVGGERVDSNLALLIDAASCVGEGITTVEVTAVNTGSGDFVINGLDAFMLDDEIRQGVPRYPLLHDMFGNPVSSQDYFLTRTPGVAPRERNEEFQNLVVPEGGRATFYLNMIPTRPEKRFAHLYFHTNAFNLNDPDVNGVSTRGIVRTSAFGRGIGARLAGENVEKRPDAVIIPPTDVRTSRMVTARIVNDGDCDLSISKSEFRFSSGDIQDFELVSVLPNTSIIGDAYVMAPGAMDSVVILFHPETYGSRRVTLRLATNDSTLGQEGVTERGVYYWDIYGKGDVGVEVRNLQLPPAVINGPGSQGFVIVENTSSEFVEFEAFNLIGGSGEILKHSARPWPATPMLLPPGQQLRLWVELKPNPAGTPGDRTAEVSVRLKGGKTATAQVRGYVGTRLLNVAPATPLFNGAKVKVGEVARQYVAVTSIGTLPIQLNDPVLAETNPGDYRFRPLVRHVLEPGQTELIEVTYAPQGTGASSGTLSFTGNWTNGTQVVNLGGEGTTGTAIGNPSVPTGQATTGGSMGRSANTAASGASLHLYGIVPNPVTEKASLRYFLPVQGQVRLEIYDASGRMVRNIVAGVKGEGEHIESVDFSSLPSGYYYVLLTNGAEKLSQAFNIQR